jgi:hypothetical protein
MPFGPFQIADYARQAIGGCPESRAICADHGATRDDACGEQLGERGFNLPGHPHLRRWRYPADRAGVEIVRRDSRLYDSAARQEFGIGPGFGQTMADTVRWLVGVRTGASTACATPRCRLISGASPACRGLPTVPYGEPTTSARSEPLQSSAFS